MELLAFQTDLINRGVNVDKPNSKEEEVKKEKKGSEAKRSEGRKDEKVQKG